MHQEKETLKILNSNYKIYYIKDAMVFSNFESFNMSTFYTVLKFKFIHIEEVPMKIFKDQVHFKIIPKKVP